METLSPLAGKPAPPEMLVDLSKLERAYFDTRPDVEDPNQLVHFGTSGHRGSSLRASFNEAHILAITQAICDYRRMQGTTGPLYLGKDTHALSGPAQITALEVLAANQVETLIQQNDGVTPTPVISRAILVYNRDRKTNLADGIVVTPSHNPPEDGGFKYNPPHGGPADTVTTSWIENRANDLLKARNGSVKRMPFERALKAATTHEEDFIHPYVNDLSSIVDMEAIRAAGLSLAVDPLGGAGLPYWEPINSAYKLNIEIVNPVIDPTFSFMTVDHDGKIRMDPSSPYAMAGLVKLKDQYRVAFCQRRGCGPPRYCHPLRVDESKSLSFGGHTVSPHAPPGMADRRRSWENPRQQPDDRSRCAKTWPPALGNTGRFQVVRAWSHRRLGLLRR